jgi:Leucine Rich repeat
MFASAPQDLNLALNEVTEAGAESLAAFLQGRTALQRLLLRENELGDDGAVALAGALQVGCTLARRRVAAALLMTDPTCIGACQHRLPYPKWLPFSPGGLFRLYTQAASKCLHLY